MSEDQEPPASKPAVMVSACLLGVACTHRGGHKRNAAVLALAGEARLLPVCPEVAGGLSTPRAEAVRGDDGRVRSVSGEDVTAYFERGAAQALAVACAAGATRAVLKARSPSCGEGGVTYEVLLRAGLELSSEESLGAPGGSIAGSGA